MNSGVNLYVYILNEVNEKRRNTKKCMQAKKNLKRWKLKCIEFSWGRTYTGMMKTWQVTLSVQLEKNEKKSRGWENLKWNAQNAYNEKEKYSHSETGNNGMKKPNQFAAQCKNIGTNNTHSHTNQNSSVQTFSDFHNAIIHSRWIALVKPKRNVYNIFNIIAVYS